MKISALPAGGVGRPEVGRVGIIGLGVIGSAWAALHLAHGIDVLGYDVSADAAARALDRIERCRPALDALGLSGAEAGDLSIVDSLEEAAGRADFIQENAPENLAAKLDLYRRLDAAAPADIIIASSTSSITASQLQRPCVHPERILVGHPFAPAHIMPLVEIVAGSATCAGAPLWAQAYYRALGKQPIIVRRELPGFIANRFQTLVFEEALSLIQQGAATAQEIDAVFVNGPGLRWALYGPIALVAFAAGRDGIGASLQRFEEHSRRVLASIQPAHRGPELTRELERQTGGYRVSADPEGALEERDRLLVEAILSRTKPDAAP